MTMGMAVQLIPFLPQSPAIFKIKKKVLLNPNLNYISLNWNH